MHFFFRDGIDDAGRRHRLHGAEGIHGNRFFELILCSGIHCFQVERCTIDRTHGDREENFLLLIV